MSSQPCFKGHIAWAIKSQLTLQQKDVAFRRTSLRLLGFDDGDIQSIAAMVGNLLERHTQQAKIEITVSSAWRSQIRQPV